jgi:putative transposase
VSRLCALYGVTRGGFYAWQRRPQSRHAEQDRSLGRKIRTLFRSHNGCYGSPRIHRALRAAGCRVSRRRIERLMRRAGLRARIVRVYRSNPRLHRFYDQHPNRLLTARAAQADRIWVGDVTYIPVAGQWRYLAVVLDRWSRRVVAWALGRRRDTQLTRRVLDAAVRSRRPPTGLIFHSDRGSEYVGSGLRDRLAALGFRQSSTRRGPEDNAHMESFFHSLKAELVHGTTFASEAALRAALQRYVHYYNYRRAHSALDYQTPVAFEVAAA